MNDLDEMKLASAIDLVNPFQQMIHFIIAGFIFGSFHLNFLFFNELGNMISAILFFLGLRLVRNANRSFRYAYFISLFYLLETIIEGMLLITPFVLPFEWVIVLSLIALVRIIFVCSGLKALVKEKKHVNRVFIYYFLIYLISLYGSFFNEGSIFLIIVFIVLFIIMIKKLSACQKDLMDYGYELNLSSIRFSTSKCILIYSVISIIMIYSCHFIYPFVVFQYQENQTLNYEQYSLISSHKEKNSSLKIYDYDSDHYLYLYTLTTDHLKQPIQSFKMNLFHHLSINKIDDFKIKSVIITDGEHNYRVYEGENSNMENINNMLMGIQQIPYTYYAYLKPNFSSHYEIQICAITEKRYYEEDDDNPDKMKEYNYLQDNINLYYSYYNTSLSMDKNAYDVYDHIIYETDKGKVDDVTTEAYMNE